MDLSDKEWKNKLTSEQFEILRQKGTEAPFSGDYLVPDKKGIYKCIGCGTELFSTDTQYESTLPGLMGWPSFADVINSGAVKLQNDNSLGMKRTEVVCENAVVTWGICLMTQLAQMASTTA